MSNATIRHSVVGSLVIVALAVTIWFAVAQAGPTPTPTATPLPIALTPTVATAAGGGPNDGPVTSGGKTFPSWSDYINSSYFQEAGMRCGTPKPTLTAVSPLTVDDCNSYSTNPDPIYDPGDTYVIRVVVHIIQHTDGSGQISDALVQSQIDVLNEDFQALAGTPGEFGVNFKIQFGLATVDPQGQPTNGITRDTNDAWFEDSIAICDYCATLAWDPSRYLNIYTTNAEGFLGFVPDAPTSPGFVGDDDDRVVVLWNAFGRNAPIGDPYDQGRTLTHEVGHYFGLYHVFDDYQFCDPGTQPDCYTSGDTICDTNPQFLPTFDCPINPSSCGSPDNHMNYMDYSDDTCMEEYTQEQRRRGRCVLESWRVDLPEPGLLLQLASGLLGLIVLDKRRRRANG